MRTGLAVVAAALLTLAVGATALPVSSAGHEAEVRIAAQRLEDGRTEFALQIRGSDGEWGERLLPSSRFLPAASAAGRWLASSPLTVRAPGGPNDGPDVEVRIASQRLDDGRTEFALQQRGEDGEWGERMLPSSRFFPADPAVGRWLTSTPLTVQAPGTPGEPADAGEAEATEDTEVRIAAQRLDDGRTEFALQQRGADSEWGERVLPRSRFFPVEPDAERWLSSSPLILRAPGAGEAAAGTEVRLTAQRLADGRTEFALQGRGADGGWGERILPSSRFFPADPDMERWLTSSPVTVAVPRVEPEPEPDLLPSEGTFSSVSVGREHICGVRTDGTVSCWGTERGPTPEGTFTSVSAGSVHTCAIGADGTVSCWGAEFAPAPEGTFMSVSAGGNHTCGVKVDGTVACWGDNRQGQAVPPEGSFTSVSAGYSHTCGLRTDGTLTCWGEDVRDQLSSPDGTFAAVSTGPSQGCAVKTDGKIECWGSQRALPPTGTFADVTTGLNQSCAITATGAITCWGAPGSSAPPGTFAAVSAGFTNVCGLRTDGSVTCWGETFGGQASPPEGSFATVSSGPADSCGVRDDGTLACWGSGYVLLGEQIPPPRGSFSTVSAGRTHACAVSTDGSVACWGSDWNGQSTTPEGTFTSVSVGLFHSCGLRADGTVACWGSGGQATPPDGTFISVSSGPRHTCAVATDGVVTCWGSLLFAHGGPWPPPDGSFTTVTAGSLHTCGLMTDATASCWGSKGSGQSTPPRGEFTSLGAGAYHTCGVRSDGTVACWGLNLDGQSTPPDGAFTSVSAGDYHTCGVRTDGTTECWGRGSGPTPTPTSTRTPAPTGTPTPTPTPTLPATPGPELPCEDCRADRGAVWVAHTGGDGVAARNDCRDDARTGERGLPEGTPGERVAVGTGRCDGWSYVTSGSWAGWIRDRYLEDAPSEPTLDCTDCDPVESATVWIAHTDGDGVAVRDDCLDSARVERWVYPEGSQLQLVATGTGRCADWSYVHGRDSATWVRNRYLADEEPIIPIAFQIPARLLPELPIPFCTIPPTDDQNASFDDAQLRAAATEAARIWNTALQEAVRDHPLTGPAIDYTGDCPSDTKGALNGRNEIYVVATVPGSWAGQAYSWPRMVEGAVQYETDIAVTELLRPGCNLERVMTHEMGHSIGLGHGGSRGDLMYRHSDGRCPHPNTSEIGVLLDAYAP